jgi:hypothetical protein
MLRNLVLIFKKSNSGVGDPSITFDQIKQAVKEIKYSFPSSIVLICL